MLILIISDWIPDFHKLYNSVSSKIKLCQIIARPMAKLKKKKKYRATRAHALPILLRTFTLSGKNWENKILIKKVF